MLRAGAAPVILASAMLHAPVAHAQDYTSGALSGTVRDASGATVSGATVTITSQATGTSRTLTSSSSGGYRATGLPAGRYDVSATGPNGESYKAEGVSVLSSAATNLNIALAAGEAIVVTGARLNQTLSGTTTGVNVDVQDLVKNNAIGRTLSSVILLAPGTTRGDGDFGDNISIGGSSVAENAYYVNGLNTTNFDNYLGSARVPFDFYKSVELKTGGYSAEYGRATGGIVNAVTKSGTNDFMAALHVNWEPNSLRSSGKDLYNCSDDGCVKDTNRRADSESMLSTTIEAGGPIIRDRLFVYGLLEMRKYEEVDHDVSAGTAYSYKDDDPFWGVKVDAYPIDSQHLELTVFDTRHTTYRTDRSFTQDEFGNNIAYGPGATNAFNYGGVNYVGKYTGTMTDWLTVSAAYGRMRDRFDVVSDAQGTPAVYNDTGADLYGVANGGYFTDQRLTSVDTPYETERKFFRADVDLFFNAFGDHHLRGGYDVENNSLNHSSVRTGSDLCASGFLTTEACNAGFGGAGAYLAFRADNTVEINYYNTGGTFKAKNQAFYIQDEWRLTPRLTLNLGLRRDDFGLDKADGSTLVSLKENYAPRLSAEYRLWDDESGKIKAFWGRSFLPVASNTAYRQASAEYYFREKWFYDGVDANGIPILTTQATGLGAYQSACPFALTPGSSGANCSVTGSGTVPDTSAAIAHNLKATKQTEFIVGYEQAFGRWSFGLTYTHRSLDTNAEDMAIDAAVLQYCDEQGISGCSDTWTGFHQYVIANPGNDLTVNLAGLDGREVTFTAEQLGYPKAKRTYDAVDLTFARRWDGRWSLNGSYTWSKSKGNSEGFVQSDFGQDDAGITQDFDQPGFLPGAYGYLPNDRRHRIKLWGSVALDDSFTIGLTTQIESPRSLSCLGYNPTDVFANVYEAASHYCGGELSPRGTAQKTGWFSTFDVSGRYTLQLPTGQNVTLRADVFNLFNAQAVSKRDEEGDLATDDDPTTGLPVYYYANPNYGVATGYQTPRYVRLGLDISF